MALHHRANVDDMRFAYDSIRSRHSGSSDSGRSYQSSEKSYQTQPTVYSGSPARRSPYVHHDPSDSRAHELPQRFFDDRATQESPRASVETYASTIHSKENIQEEDEDEMPKYDVPEYTGRPHESSVIPATPSDFSELFPSRRRLTIRHDDSTLDGNMNLRIDTEVTAHGRESDMTLFHLRMHDLKEREFSLRRYCRDSGREVCHSTSKQQPQKQAGMKRPSFQRSLSNALSSMRTKSESKAPTIESLKRNDSGYESMHSVDYDKDDRPRTAGHDSRQPISNDTVRLEFSNYAHVDVRRTGVKGSKRYEFEYWGISYAWRRIVRKDSGCKEVSYHLTKVGSEQVLAHITPFSLTRAQVEEEHDKGGWLPPCSMRLEDNTLVRGQKDAVDVVISAGLIALVDDAIRARFKSKPTKQLVMPKIEYVGPKRMITEMFRRDSGSGQQSRPSTSSRTSTSGYSTTGSRMPTGAVRQYSHGR